MKKEQLQDVAGLGVTNILRLHIKGNLREPGNTS